MNLVSLLDADAVAELLVERFSGTDTAGQKAELFARAARALVDAGVGPGEGVHAFFSAL